MSRPGSRLRRPLGGRGVRALAATLAVVVCATAARPQDAPPGGPEPPQEEPPKEPPSKDGPEERPPDAEGPQEPPKPAPTPARERFTGTPDDLAAKHPAAVRVSEYGRSAGGLPLRVVAVTATPDEGIVWEALVVARLSGLDPPEAGALVLDVAARLAERAAELPAGVAFRFVADASPDAGGATGRAGNARPTDEDQDGDVDEDGPDDLDGDGAIGWMRVPDPAGDYADEDPAKVSEGPRRADAAKGLLPRWRIVREGRDDDGDGLLNEDGPGGVDVSRNFPAFFEEHVPAAGRWAASESETRALMDLLLADERIAAVYEIGRVETLAANPAWGGGWPKLPDPDHELLEGLRAAHGKGAVEKRRARAPVAGSLGAVCWHQLGRLWLGRAPLDRSAPPWPLAGSDAPRTAVAWAPVSGPGVPDGAEALRAEAPPADADAAGLLAETESVADFLLLLARERARVEFAKTETSGEPGVLRLETRLVNRGRLPTHTQRGMEVRGRRPLNVRVRLPEGATLVAGAPLVQVERLAGGAEHGPMRWVVSGPSGAKVTVECTGPDTGTTVLEGVIP